MCQYVFVGIISEEDKILIIGKVSPQIFLQLVITYIKIKRYFFKKSKSKNEKAIVSGKSCTTLFK